MSIAGIVIRLINGELISPFDLDSKNGINGDEITDLGIVIDNARKTYGDNYLGTFDFFVFNINGEKIRILSKCSYERVLEDSGLGKSPNFTSVFGQKDEGGWEYRKFLREVSLSTAMNPTKDGISIGQKDSLYQASLLHDILLYQLFSLYVELQIGKKSIDKLRKQLESMYVYRERLESYPEDDHLDFKLEDFDLILNYIEKELENYKQTSFINRLFKK